MAIIPKSWYAKVHLPQAGSRHTGSTRGRVEGQVAQLTTHLRRHPPTTGDKKTLYPLVNIQKAIENGHLLWIVPLSMVIFHSFLYVYQRVFIVV
jgi:hypothetical protein